MLTQKAIIFATSHIDTTPAVFQSCQNYQIKKCRSYIIPHYLFIFKIYIENQL